MYTQATLAMYSIVKILSELCVKKLRFLGMTKKLHQPRLNDLFLAAGLHFFGNVG